MKTNELKKGDRVQLRNGWMATIADNKKGNIRMATVEGIYTETGSVYAHDIASKVEAGVHGNTLIRIEHTPAQLKLRKTVEEIF